MSNNEINPNSEVEKLLKNKMSELSSGVNCFDRISDRAFPENDAEFEVTVSEVENVSGRARIPLPVKLGAAAAAVIVCAAVIPHTAPFQNFLANVSDCNGREYSSIVSELNAETDKNSYKQYDMLLRDYAKYDIMYNPVCKCPFEYVEGDEDTRVRLFVRTFNDIPTDQMYAVEYSESYKPSNFIAVAETDSKFTQEELEELGITDKEAENYMITKDVRRALSDIAVQAAFDSDRYGEIIDKNGDTVTVASYVYDNICKCKDEVKRTPINVVYFKKDNENVYNYEIICDDEHSISWKRSLYTDDTSAMPVSDASLFKTDDFVEKAEEKILTDTAESFVYYEPYNSSESLEKDDKIDSFEIKYNQFDREFAVPADKSCKSTMRIYMPHINFMSFSSLSDPKLEISIPESGESISIHSYDFLGDGIISWRMADSTLWSSDSSIDISVDKYIYPELQKEIEDSLTDALKDELSKRDQS